MRSGAVLRVFRRLFTHKATLPKEINSLLWAKERIQKDYLYEISDEEFYAGVFGGVNSLLDRYSAYMTADENDEAVKKSAGQYSGLGMYFVSATAEQAGMLTVSRTAGGSPAEAAGIADGSRITGYGATADSLTACVLLRHLWNSRRNTRRAKNFTWKKRATRTERKTSAS